MKKNWIYTLACSLGLIGMPVSDANAQAEFELNAKKVGAEIQSTMYGLFFEDINFGADGGLYAEMVKNRSFDFPQSLMGWYTFGNVKVRNDNPLFPNNPNYLQLSYTGHDHKHTGIENEGFRGMGFKKDESYRFTMWSKKVDSVEDQKVRVELIDSYNHIIGSGEIVINSNDWQKYEVVIQSKATEQKGRLRMFFTTKGNIYVEHVSLFPVDTWKGRENGLRKDLAQALYDINPGVFRFPGGCIVEGTEQEDRYEWKKTVGPVENRPLNKNRWEYTFTNRYFPDYYQSYGLGFYEYFLLSEDMGAEPLPILNCGLVCQYQNDEEHCHIAVGELEPLIQDALDLIEFANGDVSTTWGKLRAEMGHPEPFNLKYLGVGNEQWGQEYVDRLAEFVKVLRKEHPEIMIVGSSGPYADGKEFDYLWPEMKRLKVDLVDEHYYKEPKWFLSNAARYDNYDRKGPAVFAGEYASHDHSAGKDNNMLAALSEAAFMTGLERNADIVHMCTYAPLFAHVDAWQWKPDMIWFDNLSSVRTPNYYVQQMYGHHTGTNVMPLTWDKKPVTGQDGLYASAVYDKNENCYIVKIVNTNDSSREVKINVTGLKKNAILSLGECIALSADNLKTVNTLALSDNVVPKATNAKLDNNTMDVNIGGYTFGVYKIKL